MSIPECFPMRKRRHQNTSRTSKRSPCDAGTVGPLQRRTPRRISQAQSLNSSLTEQPGLEIIWDNQSPSPGRVMKLGKRKKAHGSDSSSGGEISDLVKKLADQSGTTPEANPLLKFWMCREGEEKQQETHIGKAILTQKNNVFQTPARKPRRAYRRSNRTKVKQLTKELELLAHHINEPEADELLSEKAVTEEKRGNPTDHVHSLVTTTSRENTNNPESALTSEDELFDVWESDGSEDLILSQVDMSALCNGAIQETQVFTQTQTLGSDKTVDCAVDTKENKLNEDNCIVTETWNFVEELGDSEGEEFLQTALEDFERSQSVLVSKTPSKSCSLHVGFGKGTDKNASKGHPTNCSSKLTSTSVGQYPNNSENRNGSHTRIINCRKHKENTLTEMSNSRLKNVSVSEGKKKVPGLPVEITSVCAAAPVKRNGDTIIARNKQMNVDHWTGSMASERTSGNTVQKYSREDIERKRILAQQKRKQKLGQYNRRS